MSKQRNGAVNKVYNLKKYTLCTMLIINLLNIHTHTYV